MPGRLGIGLANGQVRQHLNNGSHGAGAASGMTRLRFAKGYEFHHFAYGRTGNCRHMVSEHMADVAGETAARPTVSAEAVYKLLRPIQRAAGHWADAEADRQGAAAAGTAFLAAMDGLAARLNERSAK